MSTRSERWQKEFIDNEWEYLCFFFESKKLKSAFKEYLKIVYDSESAIMGIDWGHPLCMILKAHGLNRPDDLTETRLHLIHTFDQYLQERGL